MLPAQTLICSRPRGLRSLLLVLLCVLGGRSSALLAATTPVQEAQPVPSSQEAGAPGAGQQQAGQQQEGAQDAGSAPEAPVPPAPAQQPPPAELPDPLSAPTLTPASIAARVTAVQAASELTDEQRASALAAWEQARLALEQAASLDATKASFDLAREEAPARLATIREQLAQPLPAPEAPPEGASLTDLLQRLDLSQAALTQALAALSGREAERSQRTTRRAELPTLIAQQHQVVDSLPVSLPSDASLPPLVDEARRSQALASGIEARSRLASLTAELASYEARGELLTAREDLAARDVRQARALVDLLTARVADARRIEAEKAAAAASAERVKAMNAHPEVVELTTRNADLAARRVQLASELDLLTAAGVTIDAERADLAEKRSRVQEKVKLIGFTDSIALLLRKHLSEMPDPRVHMAQLRERKDELAALQVEDLDLLEESSALRNPDRVLDQLMERVDPGLSPEDQQTIRAALETAIAARSALLTDTVADLDRAISRSIDLESKELLFVQELTDYTSYIEENVFWVPSAHMLGRADLDGFRGALVWMLDTEQWTTAASTLWQSTRSELAIVIAWGLFALGLLALRPAITRRVVSMGEEMVRQRMPSFLPTLWAFIALLVTASAWPLTIFLASQWLLHAGDGLGRLGAVGLALEKVSGVAFPLALLRRSALPGGLGEVHLRWPKLALQEIRRWLPGCAAAMLLTLFLGNLYRDLPDESYVETAGRVAIMASMLTLAFLLYRLIRPGGEVMAAISLPQSRGLFFVIRMLILAFMVVVPLLLAIGAAFGYLYTAIEAGGRLFATWVLVLLLVLLRGVLLRGLYIVQRRVRLEQVRARREAARAEAEAQGAGKVNLESGGDDIVEEVDLDTVNAQTRTLVQTAVIVALFIGLAFIWAKVLPALGLLGRFGLWSVADPMAPVVNGVAGLRVVSVADVVVVLFVLVLSVVASRNIPGLLDLWVLRKLPLAPGMSNAVTTLVRYLIALVTIVTVSQQLGISWHNVQWLVAGVSVGLGFGLQEIFANFVSGLIILFERPARVGDIVTVGGMEGVVTRLNIRATTLRDWDRREILVPNKEFITSQLVNWTLTDPITRLVFPIGVAYGSSVEKTTQVLLEVARKHPLVLEEPAPHVVFRTFGDSALNFELRTFLGNRDHWATVTHEVNEAIDTALREAGITIPFPQRDVHLYSMGGGLSADERAGEQADARPAGRAGERSGGHAGERSGDRAGDKGGPRGPTPMPRAQG